MSEGAAPDRHGRRRVLVISYAFAPLNNPSSLVATRIVRYLAASGWDPTVLTVDAASSIDSVDPELLSLIPPEVTVHRIPALDSRLLVDMLRRLALGLLYLPDPKVLWALSAIPAARRLLAAGQFDLVYTHAQYFTSHLVGLRLAGQFKVPWVSYFTDPWVDNPYIPMPYRWQRSVNAWMERRVVEESDQVVFTNARTLDLVMAKYPDRYRNKARWVPMGYDRDDFPPADGRAPGRPLQLVHTGHFYGDRSARPVLEALASIHRREPLDGRIDVRLIGAILPEERALVGTLGLTGVVSVENGIPYRASLKAMREADVLLLVEAPARGGSAFLPSKLVDYLAAGKLVFGVTTTVGVAADLLAATGNMCVDVDDVPAIAAGLEDLLRRDRWEPAPVPGAASVIHDLDARQTAHKMGAIFWDTVGGNGSRP